jgi:AraC-like DNA-binding protein
MESFSTRGLAAPRKVAYWNALNSETFAAMEITPRNVNAFSGELRREPIGALTLMDVHSDAVRIRHTQSHIGRVTTPSYLLLTPLQGDFQMHFGRQPPQRVATGEYCLLDHAQPYELQHGDAVRVLCLDIPRTALNALLPRPQAAVGRVMRAESTVSRLVAVLLRDIAVEIMTPTSTRIAPMLAQGILGFVAAAYAEESEITLPMAAARRLALLACIDRRLPDPQLCPADIAREAGVSPRRLRELLAEGGESFSVYVLRRRLEHCAQMLRDASWRHNSITEIAFRAGFNNATHFGYAFKQRYGRTPRDFRSTP